VEDEHSVLPETAPLQTKSKPLLTIGISIVI
jgi:hypothetical protein